MYLSNLKLWNFRKFGNGKSPNDRLNKPDLTIEFQPGINLVVGENDSGKTVVIDSIKLLLCPNTDEYVKFDKDDFYNGCNELRIEAIFKGLTSSEAKNFIEYMSINCLESNKKKEVQMDLSHTYLRVFINIEKKDDQIQYYELRAGADNQGIALRGDVRKLLRVMYLKPLRDAENELKARHSSRLSKIFGAHDIFKTSPDKEHKLVEIMEKANKKINAYFQINKKQQDQDGYEKITKELINYLESFLSKRVAQEYKAPEINISDTDLSSILSALNLKVKPKKPGLGILNILFIAAEMLLLKRKNYTGLRLGLIEEIEAHLHTQQQMRVLTYLQEISEDKNDPTQLILTTHSTHIASKVNLQNLIMLNSGNAFPMVKDTKKGPKLEEENYVFLKKFLDSTKANLFFAEGVILVEGFAENILLPTIAKILGCDLTSYGVSIVNVQHIGLMHYSRIFARSNRPFFDINIACVIDLDCKYEKIENNKKVFFRPDDNVIKKSKESRNKKFDDGNNIKTFVSPNWTLEFDVAISKNLRKYFYQAVKLANKTKKLGQEEIIKIKSEADKELEKWISEEKQIDEVAYEIYKKCRKNKATTALWFAKILEEEEKNIKSIIEKGDEQIRYLIEAIEHVTKRPEI